MEMPRKSTPQWTWPTEVRSFWLGCVCRPSTPSASRLKHMEKRRTPAASAYPGTLMLSSPELLLAAAAPKACASFGGGRPSPKMPSKGPISCRASSTINSKPFCMNACVWPMRTSSDATFAAIWPLPKVNNIEAGRYWVFAEDPILGSWDLYFGRSKVLDLPVPVKHLPQSFGHCSHWQSITMQLLLPVSATRSNCWGGVPTIT
mmetsp:Transcript_18113/g.34001  ORF Transcript_18113/g.34001 Transcript_18113/m.34001 type:complete len:204 (+) Transcript_18113:386-997(+)